MKVEIATCPCSWGVFWPDGSPSNVPAGVFLDQAAASGYVALELGPVGYLPTDRNTLDAELSKRGLIARAGTACYTIDEAESFADFKQRADDLCGLLKSFNIEYLMMMDESPLGKDIDLKKANRKRVHKCYGIVKDYAEYAKANYGITVVFHPHARTIVETEAEILEFMEMTGCQLCLDFGHHQLVNGKPVKGDRTAIDFYLAHHKRIPYLHFKNVDAELMRQCQLDPAAKVMPFSTLEDGVIDYVELKKALEQTNYNGIGCVEQDMAGKPAQESFELSKKNREFLARIGMIEG